jgi:hypothetical protein
MSLTSVEAPDGLDTRARGEQGLVTLSYMTTPPDL